MADGILKPIYLFVEKSKLVREKRLLTIWISPAFCPIGYLLPLLCASLVFKYWHQVWMMQIKGIHFIGFSYAIFIISLRKSIRRFANTEKTKTNEEKARSRIKSSVKQIGQPHQFDHQESSSHCAVLHKSWLIIYFDNGPKAIHCYLAMERQSREKEKEIVTSQSFLDRIFRMFVHMQKGVSSHIRMDISDIIAISSIHLSVW